MAKAQVVLLDWRNRRGALSVSYCITTAWQQQLNACGPLKDRETGFVDSHCGVYPTPARPRLSPGVGPPIGCIQHRQHGAALGALADLRRPRQQLRLATAQPMHRDEHELAVE